MNNFQAHVYPVSDSFKEKYFNPHLAAFRGMYCLKPIRPLNFTIVSSGERFLPGLYIRRKDGSTMSSRGRTLKSLSGGNLSSAWLLARCKNRRIAVNLLRDMVDEYRGLRRTSDVDQLHAVSRSFVDAHG